MTTVVAQREDGPVAVLPSQARLDRAEQVIAHVMGELHRHHEHKDDPDLADLALYRRVGRLIDGFRSNGAGSH